MLWCRLAANGTLNDLPQSEMSRTSEKVFSLVREIASTPNIQFAHVFESQTSSGPFVANHRPFS
jgi:hypothetical protein